MYEYPYAYVCATQLMKKEAINLKENKGSMEEFGGRKGKGERI